MMLKKEKKNKLYFLYYSCWFDSLSTKKNVSLGYSSLLLHFQTQMPKAFKSLCEVAIFLQVLLRMYLLKNDSNEYIAWEICVFL